MTELLPCPLCRGHAQLTQEKQYKIMIQSWHDEDEAIYFPACIRCTACGIRISRAANKGEFNTTEAAQKEAIRLVTSVWNTRIKDNND